MGSIPGSGRSPGEGNGNLFQYSCLGNPRDGGAWWATNHEVAELDMTEQINMHALVAVYTKEGRVMHTKLLVLFTFKK